MICDNIAAISVQAMKRRRKDTSPTPTTSTKSDPPRFSQPDPAVPDRVELGARIAKLCAALDAPPDSHLPDPAVLPIPDSDPLEKFWETRPSVPISIVSPHSPVPLPKETFSFLRNPRDPLASRAPPPRPEWMGLRMASQVNWVWTSSSHGHWYGIM